MSLESLLQRADIWRGGLAPPMSSLPSGFAELDALLPGGGWPQGTLMEILIPRAGVGELRLLLPALARLSQGDRWVVFVAPPYIPYAPALAAASLDLSRVLLVHPRGERGAHADTLWAVEQALRAGSVSAVLAWPFHANRLTGSPSSPMRNGSRQSPPSRERERDGMRAAGEGWGGDATFNVLRRLQLAAEAGASWGVLFQPEQAATAGSPAALRLRLEPAAAGLHVHVIKRRGGWPAGPVTLGLDDAVAVHPPARSCARRLHTRQTRARTTRR